MDHKKERAFDNYFNAGKKVNEIENEMNKLKQAMKDAKRELIHTYRIYNSFFNFVIFPQNYEKVIVKILKKSIIESAKNKQVFLVNGANEKYAPDFVIDLWKQQQTGGD